jgi:hypothetical protein
MGFPAVLACPPCWACGACQHPSSCQRLRAATPGMSQGIGDLSCNSSSTDCWTLLTYLPTSTSDDRPVATGQQLPYCPARQRHRAGAVRSAPRLQALHHAVQGVGGLTVRGLRAALGSSDDVVLRAAERVRQSLLAMPSQSGWQLCRPSFCHLPEWVQSPCGTSVCWQAAPGARGQHFVVRPDGRLAPIR